MSARKGAISELKFEIRARELGFKTLWPSDVASKYDVAIEKDGQFIKIQVKSTGRFRESKHGGEYNLSCKPKSGSYEPGDYDYLAAYIEPEDSWYLIPFDRVQGTTLCLYPHRPNPSGVYEEFKEAWNLLS